MSELRKDASGGSVAAQADVDAFQGDLSAGEVLALIEAEAPDIDALVDSGDISIDGGAGAQVIITFKESATGQKASTVKLLASHLHRHAQRADIPEPGDPPEDPPLAAPAEWTLKASDARSWVSRMQSFLNLW